ncbi:TPA: hypothetical protein ACN7L0_005238, partial [Klebsiella pneumoniae]
MSTYKTKNPLGSAAVKDLYDNAENVDKFVNDRTKEELEDRLGVLRKTWHGMEMIFSRFIDYITGRGERAVAAIGWQELGNWAVGLAVDNRQQIVYYNGSWYKYLGELEHVIAGDSPENDGGVWSAANPTGKWSNIGDAALRSNLGSGEGAMKVYRNASPLARIIRSSIFEYLTEADQQALLTIPGVNVIADYALKKAIADGVMVLDIPWNVGALNFGLDPATLPLGFQFIGWGCRRPYTIDDDNSFLNCGVVIRVAAGASFPFYSTGRHVFRDIVFDGRDKTTYLFYSPSTATQFNGTRLEGCGFYRFAIGIGWASGGTARY